MKSKAAAQHLVSIQEVHQRLNRRGIHPKTHAMDNECSVLVKECIAHENKIELMLVPTYLYRSNAAEKVNRHLQMSLYHRFSDSRYTIPFAPIVQITTSGYTNTKPTSTFPCQSKTLYLRNRRGQIILQ